MKRLSVVSDRLRFSDSSSKFSACIVVKGQTRCSKDYDSPQGRLKGQIDNIPRVSGLLAFRLFFTVHHVFNLFAALLDGQSQELNSNFSARQVVASVAIRAAKLELNLLQKVELESTLRNTLPQLHKRGNTGNNVFQLIMQQCCETS